MAFTWEQLTSRSRVSSRSLFGGGASPASPQLIPPAAPRFSVPVPEPLWVPVAYVTDDRPSPAPGISAPSGWSTTVQVPVFYGRLLCDWAPSRTRKLGEGASTIPTLPKGTLLLFDGWTYGDTVKGIPSGKPYQGWYRLRSFPLNLDNPEAVKAALCHPCKDLSNMHQSQSFRHYLDDTGSTDAGHEHIGYHSGEDWSNRSTFPVKCVGDGVLRVCQTVRNGSDAVGYLVVIEHSSYSAGKQKLVSQFQHMSKVGPIGAFFTKGTPFASTAVFERTKTRMAQHLHWEMRLLPADWAWDGPGRYSITTNGSWLQGGYWRDRANLEKDGYRSPHFLVQEGRVTMDRYVDPSNRETDEYDAKNRNNPAVK